MALKPGKRDLFAVLTGDLVRSTDLAPDHLLRARTVLSEAGADIAAWSPRAVAAPVEFFRGDSWQFALGDAQFFLRASLYVRAKLRAADILFDSRIGVGLGRAEQIDTVRTSLSTGEAFLISGRTLDKSGANLSIGVPETLAKELGWLDPMAGLCSAIADRWTERQSQILCRMLTPSKVTQQALAANLKVTPQTVQKALAGADYRALASAIDYVEAIEWEALFNRPRVQFI